MCVCVCVCVRRVASNIYTCNILVRTRLLLQPLCVGLSAEHQKQSVIRREHRSTKRRMPGVRTNTLFHFVDEKIESFDEVKQRVVGWVEWGLVGSGLALKRVRAQLC